MKTFRLILGVVCITAAALHPVVSWPSLICLISGIYQLVLFSKSK